MGSKVRLLLSVLFTMGLLSVLTVSADSARTITWDELLPPEDLEALTNPPEYLNEIEDGSFEDQISNSLEQALSLAGDDAYQQALISTKVVPEMDGQQVKIPGFIVPLSYDKAQRVTAFFIVPYFGACIHVPPPPPNQIIYAEFGEGSAMADIYDAYWITGELRTALTENEMATSAYSLTVTDITLYDYEQEAN